MICVFAYRCSIQADHFLEKPCSRNIYHQMIRIGYRIWPQDRKYICLCPDQITRKQSKSKQRKTTSSWPSVVSNLKYFVIFRRWTFYTFERVPVIIDDPYLGLAQKNDQHGFSWNFTTLPIFVRIERILRLFLWRISRFWRNFHEISRKTAGLFKIQNKFSRKKFP